MGGVDGIHMQFEFYVLNYNRNKQKVEMFNIFDNVRVQKYTEKAVKEYLRSPKNFMCESFGEEEIYGFNALIREIDNIIRCEEWSRFEYECSCGYAFETDCSKLEKIDCYYQAHANIKTITHEIIRQYKEQESKEFVCEFNKNKVTKEFLDSCKKAGKLFR